MEGVLIRRGEETQTHRGGSQVMTAMETEVIKLPVKESHGLTATTRGKREAKEGITETLRGPVALLTLDFELAFRIVREDIAIALIHPICGGLFQ